MSTETEIELIKKDVKQLYNVYDKLDVAIDKLTDISGSIKSMLAVHEEKLSKREDIENEIFRLIEQRRHDTEEELKTLHSRITTNSKEVREMIDLSEKRLMCEIKALRNDIGSRVGLLEKWKWIILGGSIVVGWVLSKNFMPIIKMMSGGPIA
jgi:chromosome segregation ATPase